LVDYLRWTNNLQIYKLTY